MASTPDIIAVRKRLMLDFPFYAQHCLKIRTKSGEILPFVLNSAQQYLHEQIEKQRREKGYVRAIVLKGRQQGVSTYTEARYFWRVTHKFGQRAFILTHIQDATDNLFNMVARFYEHVPDELKPHLHKQNQKELIFDELDSGYKIGTAGTRGVGRSSTIQYFHWSEVAFCLGAYEHAKGIMQAISEDGDTEVILESTANGASGYFYNQWKLAEEEQSELMAIFLPWYWQAEYVRPIKDKNFELTKEELELQKFYNLSPEQINWRRAKIIEFGGQGEDGEISFKQEYPCTPDEAFMVSNINNLFSISDIMRAMKNTENVQPIGAKILGVDVARYGNDYTAFAQRQGRVVSNLERFKDKDGLEVANLIYERYQREKFDFICIDTVGVGVSVFDHLKLLFSYNEFNKIIVPVNGAKKPILQDLYINKKAENWCQLNAWLKNEDMVKLPDNKILRSQLSEVCYSVHRGKTELLDKRKDKDGKPLPSPDVADALALTFALPEGRLQNTSDDIVKQMQAINSGKIQPGMMANDLMSKIVGR